MALLSLQDQRDFNLHTGVQLTSASCQTSVRPLCHVCLKRNRGSRSAGPSWMDEDVNTATPGKNNMAAVWCCPPRLYCFVDNLPWSVGDVQMLDIQVSVLLNNEVNWKKTPAHWRAHAHLVFGILKDIFLSSECLWSEEALDPTPITATPSSCHDSSLMKRSLHSYDGYMCTFSFSSL